MQWLNLLKEHLRFSEAKKKKKKKLFATESLRFKFLLSGYAHEHVTFLRHPILPKHQLV